MRFVVICLLILVITFLGHTIYYRSRTQQLLNEAVAMLPGHPEDALKKLEPALKYNDMVALGKVGEAAGRFKTELARRIQLELDVAPPAADAYRHATAAMDVLTTLDRDYGVATREQAETIVKAASQAMPVIRDRGTLSTWQQMIGFFVHCRDNNLIPTGVMDNLDDWLAQAGKVPLRPLGLREVREQCVNQFMTGLRALGLTASDTGGPFVMPAPERLSNQQLIAAETAFNNAQNALQNFPRLFREKDLPPELLGLQAKLCYNKAAIKTAHIQEYGDTARRSGTGYIAELLIEPTRMVVPTPQELFGAFTQGARSDFLLAQRTFQVATSLPTEFRTAYAALSIMGQALLDMAIGDSPGSLPVQAQSLGARVTGKAASIVATMNKTTRVSIIVEVP